MDKANKNPIINDRTTEQAKSSSLINPSVTIDNQSWFLAEVNDDLIRRISGGLNIIGEIDEGNEKYECIKYQLQELVNRLGPSQASHKIWDEYPGAAAAFLVLVGIYDYAHGDYWDFALQPVGIPKTTHFQHFWGDQFLRFLVGHNLVQFDEDVLKYVGRILGHTMIPNDCLPDFFGHLLDPTAHSLRWIGLSEQDVLGRWLGQSSTVWLVDKPVWQFLRHGGNSAEAFVRGTLRMASEYHGAGRVLPAGELNLSPRIIRQYEEWIESPAGRKSMPHGPQLRLDPVYGTLLTFPDQILLHESENQICTWEISVAGVRYKEVSDLARRRGEDIVFSAPNMPLPPEGPYEIQLMIGEKPVKHWRLEGMNFAPSWKAFSSRYLGLIDISKGTRAKPTWFLIPNSSCLTTRNSSGDTLAGVELETNLLSGDWEGYKTILEDLSSATAVEVCIDGRTDDLRVEYPSGEASMEGGDVLQIGDLSIDHLDLYGDMPPQVVFRAFIGKEADILSTVKLRISDSGFNDGSWFWPSKEELASAAILGDGHIIIDLRKLLNDEPYPREVSITAWIGNKRRADHQFRWVPGFKWSWSPDGKEIILTVPSGVEISEVEGDSASHKLRGDDGLLRICLPPMESERTLRISSHRPGARTWHMPLRLCGPRWAFLKSQRDIPIWYGRAIEIQPKIAIEEAEEPSIIFEVRDQAWIDADLTAEWFSTQGMSPIRLSLHHIHKEGRWLVRLDSVVESLRSVEGSTSHIYIEGRIPGFGDPKDIRICMLSFSPPATPLRWALELDSDTQHVWTETSTDILFGDLLQATSPCIVFQALEKNWDNAKIRAYWRSCDALQRYCELPVRAYSDPGKWAIFLAPAVEAVANTSITKSEVCLEAKTRHLASKESIEIQLLRIVESPSVSKTYAEWVNWIKDNRLRKLALNLLCELSPHYGAPLDLLAAELLIPPELVKHVMLLIKHECPECSVSEYRNCYRISKDSYRRMLPVLEQWFNRIESR